MRKKSRCLSLSNLCLTKWIYHDRISKQSSEYTFYSEWYPRGRRGSPAKGVGRETVARVQISLTPPKEPHQSVRFFFAQNGVWHPGISLDCTDVYRRIGIYRSGWWGQVQYRKGKCILESEAVDQMFSISGKNGVLQQLFRTFCSHLN